VLPVAELGVSTDSENDLRLLRFGRYHTFCNLDSLFAANGRLCVGSIRDRFPSGSRRWKLTSRPMTQATVATIPAE
jgi:hypothetical protein